MYNLSSPSLLVPRQLTFNPIQRIEPTSLCASGDRIRSIVSVTPVIWPGFKTEEPENGRTETSLPWYKANPTSSWGSIGSPIKTLEGFDLGTKRTKPGHVRKVSKSIKVCKTYAKR